MSDARSSTRLSRRNLLDRVAVGGAGLAAATVLGSRPAEAASGMEPWNVHYVDIASGNTQAPIQAALDAAKAGGGGHVVVGPGTWNLSTYLRIGANTRLTLTPATVFRRTGSARFMLVNGTWGDSSGGSGYSGPGNIVIEGGRWDVAGPQPSDDGEGWMGISIWHAADVVVRDLQVLNVSNWHAVEFGAVRNGTVENCRFNGWTGTSNRVSWGVEAIQLDWARQGGTVMGAADGTPCCDITIRDNHCGAGTTVNGVAYGGFPTLAGSHGGGFQWPHQRVEISGNTVHDSAWFAIHPYGTNQAVVTNNSINNCFGGIRASYANDQGTVMGFEDLVVGNNIIRKPSGPEDRGIDVMGGNATSGTTAARVTITGNVVNGAAAAGIRVRYAPDAVIDGNTVSGSTGRGILAEYSAGTVITGNVVRDCPTGVALTGSPDSLVNGNSLLGTGTALSLNEADSADCVVSANQGV
ncbi:right-handed parallel beta-helix repeat-containing protein [Streptomyces macrosporus]|uniref:Right-handed parallel beta-helix repeat-containing protein n=1 Tax=Streptomyces macrosporus TaxID=44032 RepID=A0ABP5XEB8_9ACTN